MLPILFVKHPGYVLCVYIYIYIHIYKNAPSAYIVGYMTVYLQYIQSTVGRLHTHTHTHTVPKELHDNHMLLFFCCCLFVFLYGGR